MSGMTGGGEEPQAHIVRCDRCGGSISVVQFMAHVVCPACGSTVLVGHHWLAASSAYARQIDTLRQAYEKNHENAVIAAQSGTTQTGAVLLVVGAVVLVLGAIPLMVAVASALGMLWVLPVAGMAGLMWLLTGGMSNAIDGLRRTFARRSHGDAIAEAVRAWGRAAKRARCPSCGVENEIDAGAAAHVCSHCGASLAMAIREMWVTAWNLSIEVRRRAAAIRAPSPFAGSLRMDSMLVGERGASRVPWPQLQPIAAWLGGGLAPEHLYPWLQRYWPEALPPTFLLHSGGFAWGTWRGYPVGVYVMKVNGTGPHSLDPWPPFARIVVFVAAVAVEGPAPHRSQRPKTFRSCAGYMSFADMKCHEVTTELLWRNVERLCWQAQTEGSPPAPPVDPVMPTT
jgi:predicted RNA-binding Zn-ribbon protein involved in translation (DUF1610 family)